MLLHLIQCGNEGGRGLVTTVDGLSLSVIGCVVEFRGSWITIISHITVNTYISVDWPVVFSAKMTDDVINAQVLDSPA